MGLSWLLTAGASIHGIAEVGGTTHEQGTFVAVAVSALALGCALLLLGGLWLWRWRRSLERAAAANASAGAALADRLSALEQAEARYRVAIEASSRAFWVADSEGNVLACEGVFDAATGLSPQAAAGLGWLDSVHEHDRAGLRNHWQAGVASGHAFELEARIFSAPHGEMRVCVVRAAPVRGSAGQVLEWVVTLQDVDDQRQGERERREIERRAQESQRMDSLGVLAGGVAHDFNNLLVGVMGHAEWLSRRLDQASPLQDNLQRIVSAAERAALLCKQMLAFAGRGRFLVEPCNVAVLAQEMQAELAELVPVGTRFGLRAQHGFAVVEADPVELRQVLHSLVTNAAEAFEGHASGTVQVAIDSRYFSASELSATRLGARCAEGEYVYIEVLDDGPGIPADVLPRIFDPFFSTKFMGRGLSLAAVLGVARSHGGTIEVVSALGQGTRVRVLIPALRSDSYSMRAPVERARSGNGAVLVVDDDAEVRELARLTLEDIGLTVLLASTGNEAIEIFEQMNAKIELVLLDLTMPGIDSASTVRALRDIKPEIRVLLSSGYLAGDAIERMGETGVDAFLQKPWRPSSLVRRVNALTAASSVTKVRVA